MIFQRLRLYMRDLKNIKIRAAGKIIFSSVIKNKLKTVRADILQISEIYV